MWGSRCADPLLFLAIAVFDRVGAFGKVETMRLTDHRVFRDVQTAADFRCGETFVPEVA
jgi:hypothetical protein